MFAVAELGVTDWIAGPPVVVGTVAVLRLPGFVVKTTVVDRVKLEALFIAGTEVVEMTVELRAWVTAGLLVVVVYAVPRDNVIVLVDAGAVRLAEPDAEDEA